MKAVTLIFSLIFAPAILAQGDIASRVGDSITLKGSISGASYESTHRYTSFNGQSMQQSQDIFLNGNAMGSTVEEIAADDVMTPEKAGLVVALCPQIGGFFEEINLPVGRTATCRIDAAALQEASYQEKFLGFNLENVVKMMDEVNATQVWLGPFPVLGVAQMTLQSDLIQVTNYKWN